MGVPPTEDPGDRRSSVQFHTFGEMPHNNVPAKRVTTSRYISPRAEEMVAVHESGSKKGFETGRLKDIWV